MEERVELPRIHPLGDALADQIAAGEVVERPASVVKELLENAIDAGARRVCIELRDAGVASIVVTDDGCGIHPEDLRLAVMRHATSKLRRPEELVEIHTLGFRGEALASIAAVAHLEIRSRPRGQDRGTVLRCRPGLAPEGSAIGMPVGTRVELRGLFGNVPARRKFLRSEATELGHVTQTVLRVALLQPQVHVSLHHGSRRLVELPAGSARMRVEQVLARGNRASLRLVEGEHDGVTVKAWLAPAEAALRDRSGLYVVVRRRVVREPHVAKIVTASYGDALASGRHPLACVVVEPPRGEVDVNVHPQKSEVRFGAPQRVYAAVRAVLDAGTAAATSDDASTAPAVERASLPALDVPPAAPPGMAARPGLGAALERWADRTAMPVARENSPGYRLRTRAADHDYADARASLRQQAQVLHQAWRDDRAPEPQPPAVLPPPPDPGPELLGCLPGPVGLYTHEGALLAVDLRALRSHLVLRRLREDLGGGEVAAQGLLEPVVVALPAPDVARCAAGAAMLGRLGLHVEAFGDDAILVRAVPASLRHCVEEPDVADLVMRVLPWLRMHTDRASGPDESSHPPEPWTQAMEAMAQTVGPDPAPRLARRWLRELLAAGEPLERIPGLRRWEPHALTGTTPGPGRDDEPSPS
ncbi:DNA mismatch repair endonuclease MutL [Paraliomyxa miuraensis]|uniref:DNA mismatch repair endonuclease MutL n=1 Tax=Paraliomyxa miuraensis TaxID=376150 RepID=UPI0022593B79|nr:DNA mismatch repair endonuclease MutL [Paraliomyxa miuraensis]MCX4245905.1 DNA mismatch repair endonuclease MutL [Paraliomyxa miuraensis]